MSTINNYLYKMYMLFLLTQDSDDAMSVVVSHALQTILPHIS